MTDGLIQYLAQLRAPKITLWCYLIWYVTMLAFHFDGNPSLWINSIGLSAVIGTALVLSVLPSGGLAAMDTWQLARLYMMPLAVSSFAALIKGKGFFVIFSPNMRENAVALAACIMFAALAVCCRRWARA
jgi:hypothetical protein